MGTIDLPKNTNKVLEEETDRVSLHLEATVSAALPIGEKPPGRATKKELREKLRVYIERNYRMLLGHLPASSLPASEGARLGTRHTPAEVESLLGSMGGADRFNTGEIEKSTPLKPWDQLETYANELLRKTDSLAFVGRENACYVLGCAFRDNECRPKTVTDLSLSVNILEDDLVPPAFRSRLVDSYLIGKVICGHLIESINQEAVSPAERIVERCTETPVPAPSAQDILRNLAADAMLENARRRAFDGALGLLVSALANNALDYQFIENTADEGDYDVSIREYADTDLATLPDERYTVRLRYFDRASLDMKRGAYDAEVEGFDARLGHFLDLLEVIYRDSKSVFRVNDFEDLARKNRNRTRETPKAEVGGRFRGRAGLAQVRERMYTVREYLNPAERRISEERLAFLEKEHARLESIANPHRIQPGILLDVEASFIKRKKTTLNSMSKALDEFQKGLPEVFRQGADGV